MEYKKMIQGATSNTYIQLFRYTIVGGIAYVVDFSLLTVLTELFDVYYLVSSGISFSVGLIINYTISINWVFETRRVKNVQKEFAIFLIIGLVGLFINQVLMWTFTDLLLFHYLISKIFVSIFVYLFNFTARKFVLF
jgi:putative flippase GtrA